MKLCLQWCILCVCVWGGCNLLRFPKWIICRHLVVMKKLREKSYSHINYMRIHPKIFRVTLHFHRSSIINLQTVIQVRKLVTEKTDTHKEIAQQHNFIGLPLGLKSADRLNVHKTSVINTQIETQIEIPLFIEIWNNYIMAQSTHTCCKLRLTVLCECR